MRMAIAMLAAAATAVLVHGQDLSTPDTMARQDRALVRRFLSSAGNPLTSYRAVRRLEASARGGRMKASLSAMTWLEPETGFGYEVLSETGSGVIRSKVLRAALAAEQKATARAESGRSALTEVNYEFTTPAAGDDDLLRLGLRPLREDAMLVDGSVVLEPQTADLLRVEGTLIKRPSFWTRHVFVTRTYARLMGVRVPIAMDSHADVLIVGASSFSMTYDYVSINGVPTDDR